MRHLTLGRFTQAFSPGKSTRRKMSRLRRGQNLTTIRAASMPIWTRFKVISAVRGCRMPSKGLPALIVDKLRPACAEKGFLTMRSSEGRLRHHTDSPKTLAVTPTASRPSFHNKVGGME